MGQASMGLEGEPSTGMRISGGQQVPVPADRVDDKIRRQMNLPLEVPEEQMAGLPQLKPATKQPKKNTSSMYLNGLAKPRRRSVRISMSHQKDMGYAPPAKATVDAAFATKFPMLPAIPAAPPKMACVMLGMNSILMMNATKTIKQGMRLAIHISIE